MCAPSLINVRREALSLSFHTTRFYAFSLSVTGKPIAGHSIFFRLGNLFNKFNMFTCTSLPRGGDLEQHVCRSFSSCDQTNILTKLMTKHSCSSYLQSQMFPSTKSKTFKFIMPREKSVETTSQPRNVR